MSFSSDLAEIRFGCGLSPVVATPRNTQDILDGLSQPDEMKDLFAIEPFSVFRQRMVDMDSLNKEIKKSRGTPEFVDLRKQRKVRNKIARQDMAGWFGQTVLRWTYTPTGFRERLASFWGDHFFAAGKAGLVRRATSPYIEDAIRPNLSGRFQDLLIAAVTHPVMLLYLDQYRSTGPDSVRGKKSKGKFGLNENLAREVLELHSLGVDGPYSQDDVRQLAELFTGMSFKPKQGLVYNRNWAEPGAETVLGKSYGGDNPQLNDIKGALSDLANHPATARHIAKKLAVHFVSDMPDPALVDDLEAAFNRSNGNLMDVYAVLLNHPAAWDVTLSNVKQPFDFIASSCRALVVDPMTISQMDERQFKSQLLTPMTMMGQIWQKPTGPDGWPEEDEAWITPQGVSARLRWAMTMPQVLRPDLPDPREFVISALGQMAPDTVRFVAKAAESQSDAIGLVLASPAFQRR